MSAQKSVEPGLEAALGDMLDVMAWELELAGARCLALEEIVSDLMRTVPVEHRGGLLESLQTVDMLTQHLTSLSAFARKLSEDAPSDAVVPVADALAGITLSAVADRMTTAFGGEEGPPEQAHSAEPDFF